MPGSSLRLLPACSPAVGPAQPGAFQPAPAPSGEGVPAFPGPWLSLNALCVPCWLHLSSSPTSQRLRGSAACAGSPLGPPRPPWSSHNMWCLVALLQPLCSCLQTPQPAGTAMFVPPGRQCPAQCPQLCPVQTPQLYSEQCPQLCPAQCPSEVDKAGKVILVRKGGPEWSTDLPGTTQLPVDLLPHHTHREGQSQPAPWEHQSVKDSASPLHAHRLGRERELQVHADRR